MAIIYMRCVCYSHINNFTRKVLTKIENDLVLKYMCRLFTDDGLILFASK